ncbi:MAG: hypothetical protein HRT89_14110 [Lentisphaeria bacterium]|nr:hypothetical protein [Lentisphaeria bacterium]
MLEWFNNTILQISDPVLNWLLSLPLDLTLLIVSIGTGAIITYSRKFTSNQDFLKRCDADKKRLKELIKEAKKRGDKEAAKRHINTRNMISISTLKQEGLPLLAAILPLAILGTWAFQRLAYIPPQAKETIVVKAYFPVSAVGELTHILPQKGLKSGSDGQQWIQEILEEKDAKTGVILNGVASWQLQAGASVKPYQLEIQRGEEKVRKELLVGQRTYAPQLAFYDSGKAADCVEIVMKPVKFLGVVPGVEMLFLAPWLLAYFLIAIPSVMLIKRVGKIY